MTPLLAWLGMPVGVVLALLVLGVAARKRRPRLASGLTVAAALLLWIASTPLTAWLATRALERGMEPQALAGIPPADAIVVLGGATATRLPPRTSPELVDASDRLLHAARLHRAGKAPLLLVSGGRGRESRVAQPEASEMAELLSEWGVPREAMLLETRSTSTRENAVQSAPLLRARGVKRILLVTSAAHMVRARGAFRKALGPGVEVLASPTDFHAVASSSSSLLAILPEAGALHGSSQAWREWVARLWYRLRGWA